MKLDELRNLMIGHRISPESPLLNAPLDDGDRSELSAAFLRSAEIGNRPWASISIDDWLQAGKWWLLKIRSQMNRLNEGTEIKVRAYINLLKACWILADIVSIHPQRVHLGASSDRRNEDIRILSQVAKRSLENFPVFEFQLRDVEDNTINMWPQSPPLGTTAPRRQFGINRDNLRLETSHGEVLFQCFAEIHRTTEGIVGTESISEECFLVLEVPRQGIYLNVMLKSFVEHDICKMKLEPEDECIRYMRKGIEQFLESLEERIGSTVRILNDQDSQALEAFLWGFQLFEFTFQPKFLTASMVHSICVLSNWPSRDWNCLLLPDYDTGSPAPSDSTALLLRTIINDVVKKGHDYKSPDSKFFARDCLNYESSSLTLDELVLKVICWHCRQFEDMKLLLEGFNIQSLHDSLLQSAFLRLDHGFLSQLMSYIEYRDKWYPDDILLMVKAALSSNDTGYLLSIFEHCSARVVSSYRTDIFQLVYSSRRLGHINTLIRVIVPRPADIAAALAWYLSYNDEQSFGDFIHMVEGRDGLFKGKIAQELDLSDFYPAFVAGCSRLIETQRSHALSLYLDSLEKLAVMPALLSPDSSFLRVLLEREVVVAIMPPFVVEYDLQRSMRFITQQCIEYKLRGRGMELMPPLFNEYDSTRDRNPLTQVSLEELVQRLSLSMPHWPIHCAVKLVCDIGFLRLLCRYGTSLQQESSVTEDKENKVQGIIDHLSRLSRLEDARREHLDTLLLFHMLIHVGIRGLHCSFHLGTSNTSINTVEYQETWRWMERFLLRHSFFHEVRSSTWKPKPERLSELMSMYTKFPDMCPNHLRTQSDWDKWRGDALQILRELI